MGRGFWKIGILPSPSSPLLPKSYEGERVRQRRVEYLHRAAAQRHPVLALLTLVRAARTVRMRPAVSISVRSPSRT